MQLIKSFRYENYKEGVSINFSSGYIDPDEMLGDDRYPPVQQHEQLMDPDDSYQQKEQLLRFND